MGEKCEWKQDEDGVWETGCGNMFEVTEGTPYENDLKFCPYCGNHLIQVDDAANDGLAVTPKRSHGNTIKERIMYEGNALGAQIPVCKQDRDQMQQMTCGENLKRKIAEQKERLAMLETALEEMKPTGLYNVKISTLRDTMIW